MVSQPETPTAAADDSGPELPPPFNLLFLGSPGAGRTALANCLLDSPLSSAPDIWKHPRPLFGKNCRITRAPDGCAERVEGVVAADGAILVLDPARAPADSDRAIARLLQTIGPGRLIVAVTRMDSVGFEAGRYQQAIAGVRLSEGGRVTSIPLSAVSGDNVATRSERTPWYDGPTLLAAVEAMLGSGGSGAAATAMTPEDQFETQLLWLSAKPLVSGRQYTVRLGNQTARCTMERPKYRIDPDTLQHLAAKSLRSQEVGVVNVATDSPLSFAPYAEDPRLGQFVLYDPRTQDTVAVGHIHFALRRSTNVRPQALTVTARSREALKGHKPCVLWFTGLSGAGKSTISNLVEHSLNLGGCHTILLDGDNVRHGLNRDLGFTEADRAENIRRIAEVARLMTDAGLIALVSFISPFAAERQLARNLIGPERFFEVFVDAPLEVAESRDVKGLYRKARAGEIRNFTGIDSPYEAPESPDLRLSTVSLSPEQCATQVIDLLRSRSITP